MPATEDRSNATTLAVFGVISGALSWVSILLPKLVRMDFEEVIGSGPPSLFLGPLSFFPGLVFGIAVGLLLHHRGKVEGLRYGGYVAAAGFAYFCAFHVAFNVDQTFFPFFPGARGEAFVGLVVSGILAGLVGSTLLGLVTMRLLRVPARVVLRWSPGVGGAAGALLGVINDDHTEWAWPGLAFFVLWQGAYAASLAPLLRPAPGTAG